MGDSSIVNHLRENKTVTESLIELKARWLCVVVRVCGYVIECWETVGLGMHTYW